MKCLSNLIKRGDEEEFGVGTGIGDGRSGVSCVQGGHCLIMNNA